MTPVEQARARVHSMLIELFPNLDVTTEDSFFVWSGPIGITFRLVPFRDGHTLLELSADSLVGAKPSVGLFEHVARSAAMVAREMSDGTVAVRAVYRLPADTIDRPEVVSAVAFTRLSARSEGVGLAGRFGGTALEMAPRSGGASLQAADSRADWLSSAHAGSADSPPEVVEQVRRILQGRWPVSDGRHGSLLVDVDGTTVYIFTIASQSLVSIAAYGVLVWDLSPSPDLCRWVAVHAVDPALGRLRLEDGQEGFDLTIAQRIEWNGMEPDELTLVVEAVSKAMAETAEPIVWKFGGRPAV